MSLPRYADYKDSGVPWLGELPAHWDMHQTKRHFLRRKQVNAGMECQNRLALTMNGVVPRSLDDLEGLQSSDYEGYQIFEKDDLAFKLIDLQNIKTSRVGLVPERGIMSPAYIRLQPLKTVETRFAYWYFMALYWTQVFNSLGGGVRQTLGPEELLTIDFPLPSLSEQLIIARFLDHETAKIDALIAEQEKLLTLLAEKRQAIISHAVTRGLNSNAPTKDSGIPWLGEVPAHWITKQLRNVAAIVRGASPRPAGDPRFFAESDDGDGLVPWVTVSEITKDESMYLDSVGEYLTEIGAENSQRFEDGLVIFSNSGATLGVPKILRINCCANDGVLAFRRLSPSVDSRFLYCFLLNTTERLRTEMKQGGGQPNLNTDIVKNIGFAEPPLDEQLEIVAFLAEKFAAFGKLKADSELAISLLLERRSALIAAAVTGKIDVRQVA